MRHIGRLDAVLREIMEQWDTPGLGVGLVVEDEIVYAKGFGVQSLETRAPVTTSSVFCLASVAKPFVATAVMQLVEQGKLHLDTPLVSYLPHFKLDDERQRQVTIRQMLSHTSGMPDMDELEYDDLIAHPEVDAGAPERYVRGLASWRMVAGPGERFYYSNIAYNVLGDLIAKTAGQTFEATVRDNILLPAGMTSSTFFLPDLRPERLAVPHIRAPHMIVNPIFPYHRADAPASFLFSTILDMCQWAITSLGQGAGPGRRILSPTSYSLMWTPVARRSSLPLYESAGLGWALGHVEGVKTASHGGAGFGWTAFLVLLPGCKRAAVILCNEESGAHSRAAQAALDVLLDREPHAGTISWIVPISGALAEGGLPAANACYDELKKTGSRAYVLDEDDLLTLSLQLASAKRLDLAAGVLELNIRAFPEHTESYTWLARMRTSVQG